MSKWIKIFSVILFFALISIVLYFILDYFNLLNISKLSDIIFFGGKYSCIIYTTISTISLVALCFIPLLNTSLLILGIALFGSKIAFLTNIIAIFFSTSILYFIGDKFGEKFAIKLIGKKSLDETQNKIDHKSKFWLPILFVTPGLPDEALCLIAGMTKIKYWYLIIVSLLYHAVEFGIFCFFGSSLINWSALTLIDWIVVVNVGLIDLYLLLKFEKFLDKTKK